MCLAVLAFVRIRNKTMEEKYRREPKVRCKRQNPLHKVNREKRGQGIV